MGGGAGEGVDESQWPGETSAGEGDCAVKASWPGGEALALLKTPARISSSVTKTRVGFGLRGVGRTEVVGTGSLNFGSGRGTVLAVRRFWNVKEFSIISKEFEAAIVVVVVCGRDVRCG